MKTNILNIKKNIYYYKINLTNMEVEIITHWNQDSKDFQQQYVRVFPDKKLTSIVPHQRASSIGEITQTMQRNNPLTPSPPIKLAYMSGNIIDISLNISDEAMSNTLLLDQIEEFITEFHLGQHMKIFFRWYACV